MTAPAPPLSSPAPRRRWGLSPFGPLLGKELRQMARRKRTYFLRFAYLGLLLTILGFAWLIFTDEYSYRNAAGVAQKAQQQAELGQLFFGTFAFFTIGFMQVMAPVLTSNAIGAERLARTFDVLMMTPVSAWQVVCGKLFSRLATALTLVGLSLPVLAIVRLLGGVDISDMIGLIVLAAATATGSAALGLFFSTFIQRAWGVILLAILVQFAVYVVLPACTGILLDSTLRGTVSERTMMQLWGAWWPVIAVGFNMFEQRHSVGWFMPAAVQFGMAFLLMIPSALIVRRLARGVSGDVGRRVTPTAGFEVSVSSASADALPLVALPVTAAPPMPYAPVKIAPRGRRVGDNPVLWHAVRQPLLPKKWQRVIAVLATLGLLLLTYLALWEDRRLDDRDMHGAYAAVFHSVLLLVAVVVSATAMAGEKESDTWTLLIVSPVSGRQVVWGKFCGSVRRLLWPWGVVVAHFGVTAAFGVIAWRAALITIGMALACNMLWIATGLILSLRCRRTTAAVVINLFLPILLYAGVPFALAALGAVWIDDPRFDLAEVAVYPMPYFYEVESISRFGRVWGGEYPWGYNIPMPFFDTYWSATTFTNLAMCVTAAYLALTFALLAWAAARFDAWVGRAR